MSELKFTNNTTSPRPLWLVGVLLVLCLLVTSALVWSSYRQRFVFSLLAGIVGATTSTLNLYQQSLPIFGASSQKIKRGKFSIDSAFSAIVVGGIFSLALSGMLLFLKDIREGGDLQVALYLLVDISFLFGGLLCLPGVFRFGSIRLSAKMLFAPEAKRPGVWGSFSGPILAPISDDKLLLERSHERFSLDVATAHCAIDRHDDEVFFVPYPGDFVLVAGDNSAGPFLVFSTPHPDPRARLRWLLGRYLVSVMCFVLSLGLIAASFVLFFISYARS